MFLKLRSSRAESNWPLRATCDKTAVPTWYAEAIWTLLLFWPTVARSGRLDADLDERSFSPIVFVGKYGLLFVVAAHLLLLESMLVYVRQSDADTRKFRC